MTAIAVYARIRTYVQARTFACTHRGVHTNTHTSIYTSNLLVMRSVLSLELREKREDRKKKKEG